MMRGMFAAISGLKTHQVMLDVTAERHRQRQHDRLQVGAHDVQGLARRSCSAARRARRRQRRRQRRAGRPRRAARLDRQPDVRRRAAVTGNALDVAIQGEGFFRVAPARRRRPPPRALRSTPAPATSPPTRDGYLVTQDGFYVHGPTTRARRRRRRPTTLIRVPRGATNVAIGQDGDGQLHRPARRRRARDRGLPALATFANSAGLERASGNNRWLESANSGGAAGRQPRARNVGLTTAGRDRDVQRGPRPVVHEHDHRAARLPGQLARHLDLGRDAAGPGQPEALSDRAVARSARGARRFGGRRVVNAGEVRERGRLRDSGPPSPCRISRHDPSPQARPHA